MKRYTNMDDKATPTSWKDIRRWRKERRSKIKDMSYVVEQAPVKVISYLRHNQTETTLTWIGHSTFLLQMNGLHILTDPVWARTMGVASRLTEPGLAIRELPPIDVVLLSHSHYDHLHIGSLRKLPGNPKLLVPEGLAKKLKRKGLQNVEEYGWWEHTEIQEVQFHFVPAQHWTRRTLLDTNTSHWGGWIIQKGENGQGDTIYFAGDSGYFHAFQQIGSQFDIQYALMPIGAYEPEWIMSTQHVSPEEAIQAFLDVRGRVFIPMHYGAFRLADDTVKEALDRLTAEWGRREMKKKYGLRILKLGETLRHTVEQKGKNGTRTEGEKNGQIE
ncbi:MBL fold metallo-hydrolase [Paenibacillus larvae]